MNYKAKNRAKTNPKASSNSSIYSASDCLQHGETYELHIFPPGCFRFEDVVDYTIGTTQLGNLKSDELDQHLKTMKVGDGKWLKLTSRLTDLDTHWSWEDCDWIKKDDQFELLVEVIKKI